MKIKLSSYINSASKQLALTLDLAFFAAKLEVILLMQFILQVNYAWLISHADDEMRMETDESFQVLLKRRLNGEPIAYILGKREFYGLPLKVTQDTLIPRPDTETLVEAALAKIPPSDSIDILDLGTGTGAIALAIAKHRPLAKVVAVDASEGALKVAQENAQNLNIANVNFVLSNWFDALQHQAFDLIVSNPPYIEAQDPHLSQGDLRFEPLSALASGIDGLDAIRHIITHSKNYLDPQGWLMLEHGYNQAGAVAQLLKKAEFNAINHVEDLAGIQRVTMGQI